MTIVMFVFAALWLISQIYFVLVYIRTTRKETAELNEKISAHKAELDYVRLRSSALYDNHLAYKKAAESRNPATKTIDDPVEKITPWLL